MNFWGKKSEKQFNVKKISNPSPTPQLGEGGGVTVDMDTIYWNDIEVKTYSSYNSHGFN